MASNRGHLLTYEECERLMNTARNRDNGKPLANNTRLYDRGDCFALQLHNTDIIRVFPEGWVLNSGGWKTLTTKQRLNDWGPVTVTQRDWTWYVGDHLFTDGMFVDKGRGVSDTRAHYLYKIQHAPTEDTSEVVE